MRKIHRGRPLVSVTMPVYNGAANLGETIESIRTQTMEDWELIAVDDGSSDASWELLNHFASLDPRIKVFQHSENRGHRAASNTAFGLAEGCYIARTDQDDISLPRRLELQAGFLDRHQAVGLLASGHYRLFADGRRVQVRKERDPITVRWALLFDSVYCHSTFMYRRELVAGPNQYRYAPSAYDYEICARLARETAIRALPEPLVCYRIHSAGLASVDRENMRVGALAISAREIRRLLKPGRMTRARFCALRRLGMGDQVTPEDLKFLPDLLYLLQRFKSETEASDRQLKLVWRRILRRLVCRLPVESWVTLGRIDPLGVADGLMTNWNRKSFQAAKRYLRTFARGH